jgi:hypothetical protein
VGEQGLEFGSGLGAEVSLRIFWTSSSRRTRGGPARDRLQGLPLLGIQYQALPDLDANANAVALQHVKLENGAGARLQVRAERPTFTEPVG